MNLKATITDNTKYNEDVIILDFITVKDEYDRDEVHAVYQTRGGYIFHERLSKFWIRPY